MSEKPVAMYRYGYHEQRNGETYTFWRLDPVCNGVKCDITQPLYSQSPAEARALAIAECARVAETFDYNNAPKIDSPRTTARYIAAQIRALSSAPSVNEEWVNRRIEDAYDKTRGNNEGDALAEDAIRATLAALGVEVK